MGGPPLDSDLNKDSIVGKPYLEIIVEQNAIACYGIMLSKVQGLIEAAVGEKWSPSRWRVGNVIRSGSGICANSETPLRVWKRS